MAIRFALAFAAFILAAAIFRALRDRPPFAAFSRHISA
jgi:hypothetical protein